ncbi:MAG: polyprenyl synthetase family protein [Candidatus Omnitrophica bacterium]|nr:polyprenyl synthetase family protein [Candidatus Omnitrophota bacterium]
MQNKIKNIIDKSLKNYIRYLDNRYSLSKISPVLFRHIAEFITRDGKRVRPTLLVAGYLGFAKKKAPNLYKTALSIELLHDFMLVHDDIIDKSDTRRGKPSMHKMLGNYLKRFKNIKFSGQDLAIVSGDVMYAMAIDTFLSIKENMQRKEKALKQFIQAAVFTGMGEFIELIGGTKDIAKITKEDINKIYDYKTAHYTFACPLSTGAILAGARQKQTGILYKYGIYLGRAFQIKDDIIGLFGKEKKIGKSNLTDLQEAKKTLLIWYAFKNSGKKTRQKIRKILGKNNVNKKDLLEIRGIIVESGALDFARKEVSVLIKKAKAALKASDIHPKQKAFLEQYSQKLLN